MADWIILENYSLCPPNFHGKNILFPSDVSLGLASLSWILNRHDVVEARNALVKLGWLLCTSAIAVRKHAQYSMLVPGVG